MDTWWQHWEDKGSGEGNWPSYSTCPLLRISVLSNRHSTTYESTRDYLDLLHGLHFQGNEQPPPTAIGDLWLASQICLFKDCIWFCCLQTNLSRHFFKALQNSEYFQKGLRLPLGSCCRLHVSFCSTDH